MTAARKGGSGPRLRVVIEPEIAIGPGKADLLEAIRDTGSISAAGRRLGMSYRRAWLLIDELSRHLGAAVIDARTGGARGGGAALTATGNEVLDRYRHMEQACRDVIADDVAALRRLIHRNQRRNGAPPAVSPPAVSPPAVSPPAVSSLRRKRISP